MVITIENYTWRQTNHNVIVRVPKKDIPNSTVDVFTSAKYIKAYYKPFIFEVFLLYPINESTSRCTILDTEIIFDLEKCENQTWDTLDDTNINKKEKILIKQQIIEDTQKRLQTEQESKVKLKAELSRVAVRKQMSLDSERLENIKKLKDIARNKCMNELDDWSQSNKRLDFNNLDGKLNDGIAKPIKSKENIKIKPEAIPTPALLPRKNAVIDFTFSERIFPTPSRESQNKEEQEWIKKQTEARKIAGWAPQDLRPEEINPDFLKTKGDVFFKQKNYLGAISAYSYGIKLNPKFAALYVNRSAAHFALGNFHKCLEDSSTALDLLVPPVKMNLESRAKCYARRGAALCKLGLPSKGVIELKAALKLMPDNENLKNDLSRAYSDVEKEKSLVIESEKQQFQ